jgi:adenosine deaminase
MASPAPSSRPEGGLELEEFLRLIPKAELHCHLLGAVRYATFLDLARQAGAPVPRATIDAIYTRGEKPVGAIPGLRALEEHLLKRDEDLFRITYEYLQDAASHGVRYSEFFWNPTGTVQGSGLPYGEAQAAIVRGMHAARGDFGIIAQMIPSIDREAGPAAAVTMVEWVLAHRVPEVVGIGIDYREPEHPPEQFWKAYRMARAAGLKTTAHAGEYGMPWTNVETAVDLLEVDRIDHGYTALENPAFARRCADRGIVFTVVPTNSYYKRTLPPERWAADHPIRFMHQHGLKIHPNTDDPALHRVTPTQAWQMMLSDFGFGLDQLREFMLNGLDGAWMDAGTRRTWRGEWSATFDALRSRLGRAGLP